MSKKPKAIVITGYGTNCENEMAHACRLAGAETDIVHISRIIEGEVALDPYHFLNLAGGFLDGDDLGAGQAGAHRLKHARVKTTGEPVFAQITRFIAAGKLILGVCNGFQLMVKTGLLPGLDGRYDARTVSLTYNDSGRFEDRWVTLAVDDGSPCVFTRGLARIYLPVRHGEGKFVAADDAVMAAIEEKRLVPVRYADPDSGEPTTAYPANPNGSPGGIAGICDETGRVFGLMPHPEAFVHYTQHPRWTREDLPEEGDGLALFRNAVRFIEENLF